MPRTAFVTGATGFVGLNLVEELLAQGWRVVALHRASSDLKYLRRLPAARAVGDVTDAQSVRRAMPRDVDAVFHVAGDTSLWSKQDAAQDRVNVDGTRNVVGAALERRARRFVHTSSISAYGLQRGRIDERTAQLGRDSPVNYQRSKFLAEEAVRAGLARGLEAVILNPAGILGRYDTRNYARFVTLVATGKLPGVPPGSLSFCHARDVARAHVAAATRGRTGENYLLGGTDASFLELVREIGAALGRPVPTRATPAFVLRALGALGALRSRLTGQPPVLTPEAARMATRDMSCDSSKAVRELGFRAVPLADMVADCVAWMTAEGLLRCDSSKHAAKST
ncbi:MAG: SDR family oxidoreductase [Burkholderiales bacterium]